MKKSFILATSAALLLASCGTTKGALDKAPTSAFAEKKIQRRHSQKLASPRF